MPSVNWLAVIIAAIAMFGLGAVWYCWYCFSISG